MGLRPDHPDYEEGDECIHCVDLLFGGSTPKYVEADVSGIQKCPDRPDPPADCTVLLTQIDVCLWQGLVGANIINWSLGVGFSSLVIQDTPWVIWFKSVVLDDCYDAFVNQNVCGPVPNFGVGGYVLLYWGPTIGP